MVAPRIHYTPERGRDWNGGSPSASAKSSPGLVLAKARGIPMCSQRECAESGHCSRGAKQRGGLGDLGLELIASPRR